MLDIEMFEFLGPGLALVFRNYISTPSEEILLSLYRSDLELTF